MSLPLGSQTRFSPVAAYLNDSSAIGALEIDAVNARITRYEARYQVASLPGFPIEVQTGFDPQAWTEPNLRLRLHAPGNHEGFIGFYPGAGAVLLENATRETTIEPRQVSTLGDGTRDSDDPGFKTYTQEIIEPHLRVMTAGDVIFEGGNGLKILGPDVELGSDAGVYETGREQVSPTEVVFTWLYIEFQEGTARLLTENMPLETAASTAQCLTIDGTLSFSSLRGELVGEDATYRATGSAATLDGHLTCSSLAPANAGRSASIHLSGELRSTSTNIARQPVPVSALSKGAPSWLPIILGATVVSGSAAFVVVWRRARSHGLDTELHEEARRMGLTGSLEEQAEQAGDRRSWALAVKLLESARNQDSNRRDLADPEGMYLLGIGFTREALLRFDLASYAASDGSPERMAAICAVRLGETEKAEFYITRALARTPHARLVDEIETEEEFAGLIQKLSIRDALGQARQRLGKPQEWKGWN